MRLPCCLVLASALLLVFGSSTFPRDEDDRVDTNRQQARKRSHSPEPFSRNVRARVEEGLSPLSNPEDDTDLSSLPSDVLRTIMDLTGVDSFLPLQQVNRRFLEFFQETDTLKCIFAVFREKVTAFGGDGGVLHRLLPFVAKYYLTLHGFLEKHDIFCCLLQYLDIFHVDTAKIKSADPIFCLLRDYLLHGLGALTYSSTGEHLYLYVSPKVMDKITPVALRHFQDLTTLEQKKQFACSVARVIAQHPVEQQFYKFLFAIKNDIFSSQLTEAFTQTLISAWDEVYKLDGPTPIILNWAYRSFSWHKKESKLDLPLLVAGSQTVQEDILIWEHGLFDIYKLGRRLENANTIKPVHPFIRSLYKRMSIMATITYIFLATVKDDEFWGSYGGNLRDLMNGRLKRCFGIKMSSRLDESYMVAALNSDFDVLFNTILKACCGLYIVDEAAIRLRVTELAKRGNVIQLNQDESLSRLLGWLSACWIPFKPLQNHEDFFPPKTDNPAVEDYLGCVKELPIVEYPTEVMALSSSPNFIQTFFINLCHRHVRLQSIKQRYKAIQSLSAFVIHNSFQAVFDQVIVTDFDIFLEPLLYFIPQVPEHVAGTPVYLVEAFPEPLLSLMINLVATQAYDADKVRGRADRERANRLWLRFFGEASLILKTEADPQRKAKSLRIYHSLIARHVKVKRKFGVAIHMDLPELMEEFPEALPRYRGLFDYTTW